MLRVLLMEACQLSCYCCLLWCLASWLHDQSGVPVALQHSRLQDRLPQSLAWEPVQCPVWQGPCLRWLRMTQGSECWAGDPGGGAADLPAFAA